LIVVQIAHVRARRPARAWQRHVISFLACHAMPCHAMPAVVHVLYLTRPHYLACCCRPVLPPAVLLCFVQSCRVQSSHTHTHTHTHIHPPSHPHPLFKVLLRLVPCACPCPDLLHLPSLHTAHHTTTSYRHLTSPPQPPTNIPGKRQCPRSLASTKARPACLPSACASVH
jgi:hypothetical protein